MHKVLTLAYARAPMLAGALYEMGGGQRGWGDLFHSFRQGYKNIKRNKKISLGARVAEVPASANRASRLSRLLCECHFTFYLLSSLS